MNGVYTRSTGFLETPVARRLLEELADGQVHSAEALAETAQCEPDALSEALSLLHDAGLEINLEPSGQVQVPGGIDLLRSDRVLEACGPAVAHLNTLDVHTSLTSTNDVLMERARVGAESGTACLAEWQSAGRGRQRRVWIAPLAGSISMSLLWRFDRSPPPPSLPLVVGVAVASRLGEAGLEHLSLKWPNDLLWQRRKLGGILVEAGFGPRQTRFVVVGVGLNYRLQERLRAHIEQPVATLSAALAPRRRSRSEIAGQVLGALVGALRGVEDGRGREWLRDWARYDVTCGQRLRVLRPDHSEIVGTGAGVRDDGALLVDDGERRNVVIAGDVSVRVLE